MSRSFKSIAFLSLIIPCSLLPGLALRPGISSDLQATSTTFEGSRESVANRSLEVKGDVLMARGQYAEALHAYQQLWPQTATSLNKTGTAYMHLYAVDPALHDYELALKLDPHYGPAWNNLGAIYHGRRDYSMAERAYKQALKYDPRASVTYSNLGTTYFAQGKYKKGTKAYARALELDPEVFSPGRRNIIEEGSSREQRSAAAFYMAEVLASAGKNAEALESLRKALSEGFDDRKRLMSDKELVSLRKLPEFHELMVAEHVQE